MTLQQGIEIAQLAKAKNYAVRVQSGKVQFVTIDYDFSGKSKIMPRTNWLEYSAAKEIINA